MTQPDVSRSQVLRLRRVSLAQIAWEFFQIGITGFGGGLQGRFYFLAVKRHDWLNEEEFAEVNATASLAPGGNASNVGLEIARRLRGTPGMIVAFLSLIVPGSVIMILAGHLYQMYKDYPAVQGALEGLEAAATALILFSATKLDLPSWRWTDYVIAGITLALIGWLNYWLAWVLPVMGGLSYWVRKRQGR